MKATVFLAVALCAVGVSLAAQEAPNPEELIVITDEPDAQNTPGGEVSARYRTPEDLETGVPSQQFAFYSQQGFNARFAWRGPYLSAPVRSDPWGNRYAVNVEYLDAVSDSDGTSDAGWLYDVFILSAGPDEEVDTPYSVDGVAPGDDDVLLVIAGGSR